MGADRIRGGIARFGSLPTRVISRGKGAELYKEVNEVKEEKVITPHSP